MESYRLIALSTPLPGREAEYERWYDEQHIPDCLKLDGFLSAQRFRIMGTPAGVAVPPWEIMVIYEIESDNIAATMGQIAARARTPEMPVSDAFDFANSLRITAVAVKPPVAA